MPIEQEHSKGPWRVTCERGCTHIRSAENESLMCDETYYPWVPENQKDWDLIAAAPELLESLEAIRTMLWERPDIADKLRPLMGFREKELEQAACRAIAKARG